MSKTKQVKSVPSGFHSITSYLVITHAAEAIDFYKKAFNAKELSRNTLPDGSVLNAQIKIGDSSCFQKNSQVPTPNRLQR